MLQLPVKSAHCSRPAQTHTPWENGKGTNGVGGGPRQERGFDLAHSLIRAQSTDDTEAAAVVFLLGGICELEKKTNP